MDIPGKIEKVERQIEAVATKIAEVEGKLDGGSSSSAETPEVLEAKLARLQVEKNALQQQLASLYEMLAKQTNTGGGKKCL